MAISRRLILKLGVSYGTGVINYGNDSIVYDRELRKLPGDPTFREFMDAMVQAAELVGSETREVDENEIMDECGVDLEDSAENATVVRNASDMGTIVPPSAKVPDGDFTGVCTSAYAAAFVSDGEAQVSESGESSLETDVSAEPDELTRKISEAIARARAFQELCAQMALSDLYMQTKAAISALENGELPSPDEIAKLSESYDELIEYLNNC